MNFQTVAFEAAAGRADQLPRSDLPEVVFSGKSNVGKSSLLNKLVNRKAIARVSATPGKTATINFYRLEGCRLVDLPGYGYAKVSQKEKERWAKLVEGYFAQRRQIALVIQLLDMRHKPTEDDRTMLRFLEEPGLPYAVVCTKSDKLNKSETAAQTALFQELLGQRGVAFFPFSATKGTGLLEIRERIAQAVEDAPQE